MIEALHLRDRQRRGAQHLLERLPLHEAGRQHEPLVLLQAEREAHHIQGCSCARSASKRRTQRRRERRVPMNALPRKHVGSSLPRKEDRRFLEGAGRFVADIQLPNMLHVAFVRSSIAHARIRSIDVARARALPGVVDVLTGEDIRKDLTPVPGMQNRPPRQWRAAVEHEINIPDQPILAFDTIRHVGEGLAVIVAESRYIAEDAAELVDLDLDPLQPVTSIDGALQAGSVRVHAHLSSNVVAKLRVRKGDAAGDAAVGATDTASSILQPSIHRTFRWKLVACWPNMTRAPTA